MVAACLTHQQQPDYGTFSTTRCSDVPDSRDYIAPTDQGRPDAIAIGCEDVAT